MPGRALIAAAQLRFMASIVLGVRFAPWSLEWLLDAAQATRREAGAFGSKHGWLGGRFVLDTATRHEFQARRFRQQALRAFRETPYYERLFQQLGVDPAGLRFEEIAALPVTPKAALRDEGDAFVRRTQRPVFRSTTSGTTGRPTNVIFSNDELRVSIALAALSHLNAGSVRPNDVVQISTSARAWLGNVVEAGACARIGALVQMPGQLDPSLTLTLLRERHRLPGRNDRVSLLTAYPSYLGELVEYGIGCGYEPADFGVQRIICGGELVTAGLKRRVHQLFGAVELLEGFGLTEVWPFGGMLCSQGHLHWEPGVGLMEVVDLETKAPAQPGSLGTLVLTPFAPFRETTLLLRYDTEDVVNSLAAPLDCELRHLPATSHLLGKRRLAVQHDQGWTFPRAVLEAVEAVDAIPLPGRCGFWAVPGGVAVEVVVPRATLAVRRRLEDELEARGVPLQALKLVPDRARLQRPLPLRGDLRDLAFGAVPALPDLRAAHAGMAAPQRDTSIAGGPR